MRIRAIYEYTLIECNKLKAPAILLEDFVYLFNKAIQQYVNSVYNRCEYNQQSSDDLGWLQTVSEIDELEPIDTFDGYVYRATLPEDYLHMLGCKAEISGSSSSNRCNTSVTRSNIVQCTRLTADLNSGVTNNYYLKPSYKKPYYYVVDRVMNNDDTPDNDENSHSQSIEIHLGDSYNWEVKRLQISYIRTPKSVDLSYDEVNSIGDDISKEMEFPDYVAYEIINVYTRLLLENASDPRLQTHLPINQTIAVPN